MGWLIVLLSAVVGAGRFTVPTRPQPSWPLTYEALAHIWIGFLFCLVCTHRTWRWLALLLLVILSLFEVAMFLLVR